jgi:hypothetical protein
VIAMRSWVFVACCAACGGNNGGGGPLDGGGDALDGTYRVTLTAGSGSAACGSFYTSYLQLAQTIVISGSGVTVADPITKSPVQATTPAIDGSDIAFEVTYTITNEGGQIRGDESYQLVAGIGTLSGNASGTFEVQASPPCSLVYAVTPAL